MSTITNTYPLSAYKVSNNTYIIGYMDQFENITNMQLIFPDAQDRTITISINHDTIQTINTSEQQITILDCFDNIPAYSICFNYIVSFYCNVSTTDKLINVVITGTPKVSNVVNYATLPTLNVPFNNQAKTMVILGGIVSIVDNVDISNLNI